MNLIADLTDALAPMQKYTITTTLPFFKPANPIIEQRNPNGKWRLVDLLMINELKFDDCNNDNYPVSTSSDAVQHLSRSSITTARGSKSWQHALWVIRETGKLFHIRKFKKVEPS